MRLHRTTPRTSAIIAEQKDFSYSTLNAVGEPCFMINMWGAVHKKEDFSLELSREEMKRLHTILGAQLSNEEKGE